MNDNDFFYSPMRYKSFSKIIGPYEEIEIPDEILNYINEERIFLPLEALIEPKNKWDDDDDNDDDSEEESPTFPKFSEKLNKALEYLGGSAFLKINYVAPKDAAFFTLTSSSLKLNCTHIADIYLLLKASTVAQDTLKKDKKNYIFLKQWLEIVPESEFRCFVHDNKLIAITQRDNKKFYEHINSNKFNIRKDIIEFFDKNIKNKTPIKNYTFDLASMEKISLIDFNPFNSETTDAILFKWEDIHALIKDENLSENLPEFRFLAEDPGYVPNTIQTQCLPDDIKELSSKTSDLSIIDLIMKEVESQNKSP